MNNDLGMSEIIAGSIETICYAHIQVHDMDLRWTFSDEPPESIRFLPRVGKLLELIPNAEHQSQVIHHLAVFNSDRVFYVVGGPRILCYLVYIRDITQMKLRQFHTVILRAVCIGGLKDLFDPNAELSP